MFLDSVLLSIDIFEIVQRKQPTTIKRLKTSTSKNDSQQATKSVSVRCSNQEPLDKILLDAGRADSLHMPSSNLKRNREPTIAPTSTTILSIIPIGETSEAGRHDAMIFGSGSDLTDKTSIVDLTKLCTLVDGALRLSVTSSINIKSQSGIKIKASTFGLGLAKVAPILWRPGYLLVREGARLLLITNILIVFVTESMSITYYWSISLSTSCHRQNSIVGSGREIVCIDSILTTLPIDGSETGYTAHGKTRRKTFDFDCHA